MTNDSLRCRPQMFVGSGGKSQDRDRDTRALQWGGIGSRTMFNLSVAEMLRKICAHVLIVSDSGDIPGTSSGSQRVPGMKSMFKMYGEVALRKVRLSFLDFVFTFSCRC